MATYYRIDLEDPYFNPLNIRISDYLGLNITDATNDVSPVTLQVPLDYLNNPFDLDKPDQVLCIMESTDGSPWQLHRNTKWFVEKIDVVFDNNQFLVEVTAKDGLDMFLRRSNPYYAASSSTGYAGQAQAQLTGTNADNMIKTIARNNLGTAATDYTQVAGVITTRQLNPALFVIDPDTSEGAVVSDKGVAWRDNLLNPCQELAQQSFQNGTYLTFDTVMNSGKLTFRTFPNQRGRNLAATALNRIVLSPENGLVNARLSKDYSREVNAVYCAGQGDGNARIVSPPQIDTARSQLSPWAYRETFVDARSGGTTVASVTGEALAALAAGQPLLQFTGTITEAPRARYGMAGDIFFGDIVPVSFLGYSFFCRIEQVGVQATGGQPAVPTINLRSL